MRIRSPRLHCPDSGRFLECHRTARTSKLISKRASGAMLRTRSALERAFAEAAGEQPVFCGVCEGPRVLPFLAMLRRDELGTCDACGGATGPEGLSLRRITSEGVSDTPIVQYTDGKDEVWTPGSLRLSGRPPGRGGPG